MKELSHKDTQQATTEQASEQERSVDMAVDLFISQLQARATKDQQRRLLALLQEIESNRLQEPVPVGLKLSACSLT